MADVIAHLVAATAKHNLYVTRTADKDVSSCSAVCTQAIIARTFDYESEAKCDAHLKTFMESIKAAASAEGQGFAAVKVSAASAARLLF